MREFLRSLRVFIFLSLLTGVVYPLVITGLSTLEFPRQSQGSLINYQGRIIGSSLIGQELKSARYFHGRPSALEKAYDARNSQGSNWGPSSKVLLQRVEERVMEIRKDNDLKASAPVPADMVLASGSGLDPHISVEAAMLQVRRIARARSIPEDIVKDTVRSHIETAFPSFLSQSYVNVLRLNLALDELH